MPLRSKVFIALLLASTATAFGLAAAFDSRELDLRVAVTAIILFSMIVLAEYFEVTVPQSIATFNITVGAALGLAAGLTVGPLGGGLIVVMGGVCESIFYRRQPVKAIVNVAMHGLCTVTSASVYLLLAGNASTPLDNLQGMSAAIVSAVVYTLLNTWILALIVAPLVGTSALAMWLSSNQGFYFELIAQGTLGAMVPVLAEKNAAAVLLLVIPLVGPHLAFRHLRQAKLETRDVMESLADALERRDAYTHRHSVRVAGYVRAILAELPHIPHELAEAIASAARIHDLGKVGIEDVALHKPSRLTEDERLHLEEHPTIGAEILNRLGGYRRGATYVRHHHERWDGRGYPSGLIGEEIPLGARIISVADSFDAMTSDRVYRKALTHHAALTELRRMSGSQFDPQIVDAFERAYAAQRIAADGTAGGTGTSVSPPQSGRVEAD